MDDTRALPLTDADMKDVATELILDHGYNVEYSTVREHLSEAYAWRDVPEESRKAVTDRIYDLTVAAEIDVIFPEEA